MEESTHYCQTEAGQGGAGGKHPLFLLWSSSLLPAPRRAQLLQPPGTQRSVDLGLEAGLEGQRETTPHSPSENISSSKKGDNICPANLQGASEDQAGGGPGDF